MRHQSRKSRPCQNGGLCYVRCAWSVCYAWFLEEQKPTPRRCRRSVFSLIKPYVRISRMRFFIECFSRYHGFLPFSGCFCVYYPYWQTTQVPDMATRPETAPAAALPATATAPYSIEDFMNDLRSTAIEIFSRYPCYPLRKYYLKKIMALKYSMTQNNMI